MSIVCLQTDLLIVYIYIILVSSELERFFSVFQSITHQGTNKTSRFDERTEEASASQYFQVRFLGYRLELHYVWVLAMILFLRIIFLVLFM